MKRFARIDGFAGLHPLAPEEESQGALELIYRLQGPLRDHWAAWNFTTTCRGTQGEMTGVMLMRVSWISGTVRNPKTASHAHTRFGPRHQPGFGSDFRFYSEDDPVYFRRADRYGDLRDLSIRAASRALMLQIRHRRYFRNELR